MNDKQEEVRLLREIHNGSREAFETFYDLYIAFVMKIAVHIVKSQVEAEDVCHEVFLEVYQKAGQYDASKGSVHAWLAVKTKSRALDYLRKKKPLLIDKLESIITEHTSDAEILVLSHLEKEMIQEALSQLPKEQRDVIYSAYFKGQTHKEIAAALNRPLGTIKSMIRYGLTNLRKHEALLNWEHASGGDKKHEV